jgi:8-oxo-dGTP pyrophosphatase MutT (NUDIX family)
VIPIAAAVVLDGSGRLLVVRKKGTTAFMQPGGKLRERESALAALERELREELHCSVVPGSAALIGTFRAAAANEPGRSVEAVLYRVELVGEISIAAEIEELAWVDPRQRGTLELIPLTAEVVLPLARDIGEGAARRVSECGGAV